MPVDALPDPRGNVILRTGANGVVAEILSATATAAARRDTSESRYTSHFATCPGAEHHRKPRFKTTRRE